MRQLVPDVEGVAHTRLMRGGARLVILGPLVSVAFGRWGSYIGVPGAPIYLSDVFVGLGIIALVLGRDRRTAMTSPSSVKQSNGTLLLLFLASIPLIVGLYGAPGDLILLVRDAAPFAYLTLIPLVAFAINIVGQASAIRMLSTAVVLHTLWFAPAMLNIAPEISVPFVGVPVFTTRGDFDVLICGLTVVILLLDRTKPPVFRSAIILSAIGAGLLSGSRSGLLSAIAVALIAFILMRPWRSPERGGARSAGVALTLAAFVAAIQFVGAAAPQWAVGLQKLIPNTSATYQSGQNTWEARQMAWARVYEYVTSESSHGGAVFGTGFGSQPVLDSGAVAFLSGDPAVRAAHNFVVTWFAFTGYIGITAVLALFALVLARGIKSALINIDVGAIIGVAMMVGVLLTAATGVILESPFGYMTFILFAALALSKDPPKPSDATGAHLHPSTPVTTTSGVRIDR